MKTKIPKINTRQTKLSGKKIVLLSFLLFFITSVFAQKATDNFSGKWKTPDGVTIVIAKTGAGFIGMPEGKEAVVLNDVRFADGKWNGVITNPVEKKSSNCTLLLDNGKLKIVARKGMLSKTIYWTKL
jgi:uncharacterized protein (DUF2147 family)